MHSGRVIMTDAVSARTLEALDRPGVTVVRLPYEAMYLGGGGTHCSTAPLVPDPV